MTDCKLPKLNKLGSRKRRTSAKQSWGAEKTQTPLPFLAYSSRGVGHFALGFPKAMTHTPLEEQAKKGGGVWARAFFSAAEICPVCFACEDDTIGPVPSILGAQLATN